MHHVWEFEAIGTKWSLELIGEINTIQFSSLKKLVEARINSFDITYSRFKRDSLLKTWTNPGRYPMPQDGYQLFDFYHQLYEATDGLVTPLIGQTMVEAGYDAEYSFQPKMLTTVPAWGEALGYTPQELSVKVPVQLDFGAAGKGYLVDHIVEIISQQSGAQSCMVNAGGDMRQWSNVKEDDEKIIVGLENPLNVNEVIGTVSLHNKSLCASSGTRRTWGKFHHTINPLTLSSPSDIVATWVKADSAMVADGLATALFFVSPNKLRAFSFEYALLDAHNQLSYSKNFIHEVFTI